MKDAEKVAAAERLDALEAKLEKLESAMRSQLRDFGHLLAKIDARLADHEPHFDRTGDRLDDAKEQIGELKTRLARTRSLRSELEMQAVLQRGRVFSLELQAIMKRSEPSCLEGRLSRLDSQLEEVADPHSFPWVMARMLAKAERPR